MNPPPLTANFGARFLNPKATCAVCGRECDRDGAPVVAELDPTVEVSAEGLSLLADITPGEQLVICRECAGK
jgi:hypothetical protein